VCQDCRQGAADHHVFITSYSILLEDFEYFLNTEWRCLILDNVRMLLPKIELSLNYIFILYPLVDESDQRSNVPQVKVIYSQLICPHSVKEFLEQPKGVEEF